MKIKNLAIVLGCCMFASALFVSSAHAIVINNPGFEDQVVESGGFLSGAPTGWTAYSSNSGYGLLNPNPASLVGKQGNNVAFLNVGTSATFTKIEQSIPYTVLENDVIVLSFLIGTTNGNVLPAGEGPFPGFANYDAVLTSSTGDIWTASSQTNPAIITGDMVTWTRTYQFLSGDPRIGQTLNLLAYASGSVADTGGQVVFDAFSLQVVPEPSVTVLLGLGVAGFLMIHLSRRSRKIA